MTSERVAGYEHSCAPALERVLTNEGNPNPGNQAWPITRSDLRTRLPLRYRAKVGFLFLIREHLRYADS
jgi:hypothetical protein